jgi:AcrR family transcriptional regulator
VIYDHFGSKEQLFATCVRRTGEALADQVAKAVSEESDPRARLRAGSIAYFRFLQDQFQAWIVLFDDEDIRDARFAAEASRIRHRQSDLMIHLMAETSGTTSDHEGRPRLEAMTLAIAGAYESLSLWWHKHPEVSPEELTDWLLDLIWPGLEQLNAQLTTSP